MPASIDLSQIGAHQAALMAMLRDGYPLPVNALRFPTAPGQYYGQVATNCRLANAKASANKGLSTRNHHRARGAVTEMAIVLPNWYVERSAGKMEYPNNAGVVCAASLEYPAGTFYRFKFNGAFRELANGGAYIVSDLLPVAIPDGAEFWTNIWVSAATSIVFFNGNTGQVSANGEKANVSTGDVSDYTVNQHPGIAQTFGFWPLALIGRTSGKAVAILGDSLGEGVGDTPDTTDHIGIVARTIGEQHAYLNLAQSGDRLQLALQSYSKRSAMLTYVRNAVCVAGVNDVGAGRTLEQIKADMVEFWQMVSGKIQSGGRVFQTTIAPSAVSTDSFSTLKNQTAAPYFSIIGNGTREMLNDWLRDGAPIDGNAFAEIGGGETRAGESRHPLTAVFDTADQVESSRNSGKWKVDGTAFKWTTDGIHPTRHAYLKVAASTAIDMSKFV